MPYGFQVSQGPLVDKEQLEVQDFLVDLVLLVFQETLAKMVSLEHLVELELQVNLVSLELEVPPEILAHQAGQELQVSLVPQVRIEGHLEALLFRTCILHNILQE